RRELLGSGWAASPCGGGLPVDVAGERTCRPPHVPPCLRPRPARLRADSADLHRRNNTMIQGRIDLTRITLGVLSIAILIGSSLWILRPFLGATIWAAMVVVATWPLMLWVQGRLWKRRSLAVVAMILGLVLLFILPLTLAISTIADNADAIVDWVK